MNKRQLPIRSFRVFEVDVLRGAAIVLMIMFHFGYDLTAFGWTNFKTSIEIEWRIFRVVIVTAFLLAVGMSSYLSYYQNICLKKLTKSVTKLLSVAVLISASSYFLYPNSWIYFGIIHFITLALLLSVIFVNTPNLSLIVGLSILFTWYQGWLSLTPLWTWSVAHLGIPQQTVDLTRFFPWFSVVLFGIFLMHNNLFGIKLPKNRFNNKMANLGKRSLVIYLIHQPILFGLFMLTDLIVR
ncbi:heparan-alpha-glucosaminide N-acetyltransferase [Paraglaciecola sp.]|uniref:heparan-alpha-glucosaminide N-acetyltransferase n=1 Tax=Paraglaciecola sp. TaxID=1920173 RepID=UPI003EF9D9BB